MFVKTLNIADSVSNTETSTAYKYYWVRNLGAEDISVFKNLLNVDTDKKIILSQNEYVKIIPENNNIYFKSSSTGTKIEVYGTNTDICPFKTGKAEGSEDEGGYTETVLFENTGSTNPDTITLPEDYRNFDAIIFECQPGNRIFTASQYYRVNGMSLYSGVYAMYFSENDYIEYFINDSTTFIKGETAGDFYLRHIIGIKY